MSDLYTPEIRKFIKTEPNGQKSYSIGYLEGLFEAMKIAHDQAAEAAATGLDEGKVFICADVANVIGSRIAEYKMDHFGVCLPSEAETQIGGLP